MENKDSDNAVSLEKFDQGVLTPEVNLCNEFLMIFLNSKEETKKLLKDHFKKCAANDYDKGVKKFNLGAWWGGDMNPTLEIVEIKDEFKFATTHYGVLTPLSRADLKRSQIKSTMVDFFLDPLKYFLKNNHAGVNFKK